MMTNDQRPLDPDIPSWEQQEWETQDQYRAFSIYRDAEDRAATKVAKQADVPPGTLRDWREKNSWSLRAYEFDLYLNRLDVEELVRYRREMNKRQRQAARVAQAKIVQWLANMDPATLKPAEAARWFEVAVRIEREAAGARVAEEQGVDRPDAVENEAPVSLAALFEVDPTKEAEIAEALHRAGL